MPERNWFHATNGHRFAREDDGAVTIENRRGESVTIDADSWCSAVAAVSAAGLGSETEAQARALHVVPVPVAAVEATEPPAGEVAPEGGSEGGSSPEVPIE